MNKINNNEKETLSFRDKLKDKKYSAKLQLIGYGVFILIVIIYANLSSKNYNYDYSNKITNSVNKSEKTSEVQTEKSLLETIKDNYEYSIEVNIKNITEEAEEKEETTTYKYTGASFKDILKIKTNNKTYYLKNNEYYEETNNNYTITEAKTIYNDLDYKYIELTEILNYINKSSLDHTTNYSNGKTTSTYYLYLKDILPNYFESDYVEFNITEQDNVLNIEINYSKLMNYKDDKIKEYIVTAKYSNIGSTEEFNIDINTYETE